MKKGTFSRISRILASHFDTFNLGLSTIGPTSIIGKQVCISGEEKENDWSSFILVSTVNSILSGSKSKVLDELEKEGPELTHLCLSNGGKLILDSNQPGKITYIGPVCFSDENTEYTNVNIVFFH